MRKTFLASITFAGVLLALVSGCASTKQTEELLTQAGFKVQTATTEQQLSHIKSLPAHKVTPVQKDGKQYYVYPDVARGVLYTGQSAEYKQYKKLHQEEEMAEGQISTLDQMQVEQSVWGAW